MIKITLNLQEKYVLDCIINEVSLKDTLIGLCDIFLNDENNFDLNLFLKVNLINEKILTLNDYVVKELNKNSYNDFIYNTRENQIFVLKHLINDYKLIKLISDTFGIDFKIVNQLKKHEILYKIENDINENFKSFSNYIRIEEVEKKLKNIINKYNNNFYKYKNLNDGLNKYNNINLKNMFNNKNILKYNLLEELLKNDLILENFDILEIKEELNKSFSNINNLNYNIFFIYILNDFNFKLIKKSDFNKKINQYEVGLFLVDTNNLEKDD